MCSTTPMTSEKLFGLPLGPTCRALADGVLAGPRAGGECLVDDDRVLLRRVELVEDAPGQHARAHRPEVARRHVAAVGGLALPVARRGFV
jgi:hypothetical protein